MFKTINIHTKEDGIKYQEMIKYFQDTMCLVIEQYEKESPLSIFRDFKLIFDKNFLHNEYNIDLYSYSNTVNKYDISFTFFNNSYMEFEFYKTPQPMPIGEWEDERTAS